jgi:hypothetical protein
MQFAPTRRPTVLALLAWALGCNSNDGFGPHPEVGGGGFVDDLSWVTVDQLSGGFELTLSDRGSQLSGAVRGPAPDLQPWVLSRQSDGCAVYMGRPSCEPRCGSDQVCTPQRVCVTTAPLDVGALYVIGLGESELTLTPSAGRYDLPGDAQLPSPPCASGQLIELAADGGRFGPFTLAATCVSSISFNKDIVVERRKPLAISWPRDQTGSGRILIALTLEPDVAQSTRIECDVEDLGEAEISAALLELLIKLGASATPTLRLTRYATGGTAGVEPRRVVFRIQHSVEQSVAIPGVTCVVATDCPPSLTCRASGLCQ